MRPDRGTDAPRAGDALGEFIRAVEQDRRSPRFCVGSADLAEIFTHWNARRERAAAGADIHKEAGHG